MSGDQSGIILNFRGGRGMKWIQVNTDGWAGVFVVVRSYIEEARRYYGMTPKQAEKRYRQEFGLTGKKLVHI